MEVRKMTGNRFVLSCVALMLASLAAPPVVLGGGTVTTCDEAHLDSALSGGGAVTFSCGTGPVTIDVATAKTISANTTIDGGGLVTLRSNGSGDVFRVTGSAAFTAQQLTISNASGAGIVTSSSGTVTATGCTFSGNYYGIENLGTGQVVATNCTFTGGSYGIDSASTGAVSATGCTFSGGYYGIDIEGAGSVMVANSTFSGSDDGIDNESTGSVAAINCTFSGNDYGIENESSGVVTLTNCILADSTVANCAGSLTDGGHNLDTGTTCGFGGSTFSGVGAGLDPAGLASNGGPTQTIAVLGGSAAINAGDQAVCAAPPVSNLDQRVFIRPGDGNANCTIGAFEFGARATEVVVPALSLAGLLGLVVLLGVSGFILAWRSTLV